MPSPQIPVFGDEFYIAQAENIVLNCDRYDQISVSMAIEYLDLLSERNY